MQTHDVGVSPVLTRKQLELLDFIKTRMDRDGVPPSFDEMKDALDLKSKSGIHRLITALVERGFIHRLEHRARALEIVKLPEAMEKPGFNSTGSPQGWVWMVCKRLFASGRSLNKPP